MATQPKTPSRPWANSLSMLVAALLVGAAGGGAVYRVVTMNAEATEEAKVDAEQEQVDEDAELREAFVAFLQDGVGRDLDGDGDIDVYEDIDGDGEVDLVNGEELDVILEQFKDYRERQWCIPNELDEDYQLQNQLTKAIDQYFEDLAPSPEDGLEQDEIDKLRDIVVQADDLLYRQKLANAEYMRRWNSGIRRIDMFRAPLDLRPEPPVCWYLPIEEVYIPTDFNAEDVKTDENGNVIREQTNGPAIVIDTTKPGDGTKVTDNPDGENPMGEKTTSAEGDDPMDGTTTSAEGDGDKPMGQPTANEQAPMGEATSSIETIDAFVPKGEPTAAGSDSAEETSDEPKGEPTAASNGTIDQFVPKGEPTAATGGEKPSEKEAASTEKSDKEPPKGEPTSAESPKEEKPAPSGN